MEQGDQPDSPQPLDIIKQTVNSSRSCLVNIEQQLTPPSTQPPSSSAPRPSRSLRTCNANKSKLIYDLKYHPMDECLHPHQAARRRSAHGESHVTTMSDSESDGSSAGAESESEGESVASIEEEVRDRKEAAKGRKRSFEKALAGEGMRRSGRAKAARVLYDMNVHPQDGLLEVSSDEESEEEGGVAVSGRAEMIVESDSASVDDAETDHASESGRVEMIVEPVVMDSESVDAAADGSTTSRPSETSEEPILSDSESVHNGVEGVQQSESANDEVHACTGFERDAVLEDQTVSPRRSSSMVTKAVESIGQNEGCAVEENIAYQQDELEDNEYDLPMIPGLPFKIHADPLSDQLAAEAQAKSPLNHEHNDQENNLELDHSQGSQREHQTSSFSMFEQTEEEVQAAKEHALVEEALYSEAPSYMSTYGL